MLQSTKGGDNMRKKAYTAPEADVEKFTIAAQVMTLSGNTGGLEENENVGSGDDADLLIF